MTEEIRDMLRTNSAKLPRLPIYRMYIGKTDRTLFVQKYEHAICDKESAIYKH